MRLPALEQLILRILVVAKREMFGLEILEQLDGRLAAERLAAGTIYVTLGRMEHKGLIESWKEKARAGARGLPRRHYRVSVLGGRLLAEWNSLETV